jgi:excisionase family DNA binding protein
MRPNVTRPSRTNARNASQQTDRSQTLASLLADRDANAHTAPLQAVREPTPVDDVIDVVGVGQLLHVGRNKVYEMVARNEIPHRRFGRGIRFSRTAIMRWLDSWSPRIVKEGQ